MKKSTFVDDHRFQRLQHHTYGREESPLRAGECLSWIMTNVTSNRLPVQTESSTQQAGGSRAGGSRAGGSQAGGSRAGGSQAGGSQAGRSQAGGSQARGSQARGSQARGSQTDPVQTHDVAQQTNLFVHVEAIKQQPSSMIEGKDKATKFYTGLPTWAVFLHVFMFLSPFAMDVCSVLSIENQMLPALTRLRLNLLYEDLGCKIWS